jgi:diguanylate cyclase (GGDEF)-like protein/PAS domain S-box-containing protein
MNAGVLETTGRPLPELMGKKLGDVYPDNAATRHFIAILQRVIATCKPENHLIVVDENLVGRPIYDEVNVAPVLSAQKHLLGVLVIGRAGDHTRKLEQEISKQSRYLRALIDNFPFTVWLKDQDSRLLAANLAYAKLAGVESASDLEMKTDFDFFPHDLARGYVEDDHAVLASGQPKQVVEEFIDANQQHLWIETYKSPVVIDGKPIGTVGFFRDITMQKTVEQHALKNEKYLRALIDNFPFTIWLKDKDSRLLAANSALAKQAGVSSPDDLVMKTDFDFFPADLAQQYVDEDKAVLASGQPKYVIDEFVGADNQKLWIEAYKSPVIIDGESIGTVGFFRDITAQRALEQAAIKNEKYLQTLIENLPDVIIRYDRQYRRTFVSDNYEHLYNARIADILGKTPSEAWLESTNITGKAFEQLLEAIMQSGNPGEIELYWENERKKKLHISMRCAPEFDANGQVVSLLTIGRDISDLKEAELLLEQRASEYRTLVENSPDYVARYDRKCRRIYVNPQLCKDMGMTKTELLGKGLMDYHQSPNILAYENAIKEALATGEQTSIEVNWHNTKGTRFCTQFRITPEYNAAGKIVSALSIGRDITDIDQYRQQIHQLAFYDGLTGLPNRTLFMQRIETIINDKDQDRYFGLMLLDLDHFKAINDSMGHSAGDQLLHEVGKRLIGCIRPYDTACRLGGDEFAILLPKIKAVGDLANIAKKIMSVFKQPFQIQTKPLFVTPSAGIAFYPGDSEDVEGLFRYADSAMYHAKRQGRNNYQFYSKELTARITERMDIEADLRNALANQELKLYYQPQINLIDGSIMGAEALIRWNRKNHGMVMPDTFISVAEETGLIVEIGEWVIRTACEAALMWNREYAPTTGQALVIAVNLSPRQFIHNDLVQTVRDILQETGCNPAWIKLEITESMLMENKESIEESLHIFCDMGLTLSIDDFGTGYSSLSYLSRFPVDQLKIDRSFVHNILFDEDADSLVKAIISLAKSLRKSLVAEGVETEGQATFLANAGCELAQGYLYGKPMPDHDFSALLLSFKTRH